MIITLCLVKPVAVIAVLVYAFRKLHIGDWNRYLKFLKLFELWLERSSDNTSVYHVEKILGEWAFSMGKIRGVLTPFNFRQTRNNECPKAREARQRREANAIKLRERVRVLTKSN